ncbi:NEDD4-binding protein 2 [Bactrocera tryoni]|uniref:NEDD4-binding protein 2 n=1 Tax=Bactrocera tryoni TaxID=59916 RepID=UPI001A98BD91|nr:NEDD4-binding protein 2 [Bactrocera tryoni]
MQNSGFVPRNAQLTEEEKRNVMQQLGDIFNCSPSHQMRNLCESQAWNVDRCVDYLIKANSNGNSENQRKLRSGAVPKQNMPLANKDMVQNRRYTDNSLKTSKTQNTSSFVELRIAKLIKDCSKVMVFLRGAPGSGKSYLAKSFIESCVSMNDQYTFRDFIFSTDDFFYNSSGVYKYQPSLLDKAHEFNQRQVAERAQAGWSPIFIDNTNIKLWEMMPYVQTAVQNGYIIEILEPRTSWRNSAAKLAAKNEHGVPIEKIKIMLNNFEKCTVNDLLKMLKTTKYQVALPQIRSIPPVPLTQTDVETDEVFQIYKFEKNYSQSDFNTVPSAASDNTSQPANTPKPQREKSKKKNSTAEIKLLNVIENKNEMNVINSNESEAWQPHEQEINKFWNMKPNLYENHIQASKYKEKKEKTILDLLREGVYDSNKPQSGKEQEGGDLKQKPTFGRHSIGCENENKEFASLRQIYPNKELASLWDLFVKCGGDIDWTVDLLLREDELMAPSGSHNTEQVPDIVDDFKCNCALIQENTTGSISPILTPAPGPGTKPQRQRTRATRMNQRLNPEFQEISEVLANRFVLDGEQFSPHVRKLREMREKLRNPSQKSYANIEVQTDPLIEEETADDDEFNSETNEIIEVNLGEDLVKQLRQIFQAEMTSLLEKLPDNPVLNVFMPRSLAKELYMLWIESAYNQLEEQRQQIMSEDAHFARLLKNPKYENCKESPENIQELLDMEYAWQIYKNDQEIEIQRTQQIKEQYQPSDLASHLTQMKLCETFPSIPRETLVEILTAHDNNYNETVQVLNKTTQPIEDHQVSDLHKKLVDCTLEEQEKIKNEQQNTKSKTNFSEANGERVIKVPLQPEEAKRMALHDFEEMRNLAAHHSQLKAECYQKAKEAMQKGYSAVAVYYSQIANLHKMKLDMYNHRAANCIMDVHKYTQNNPELLDLHYLHVLEAIGCLDIFLDRHITGLRAISRNYKHIFIITGRGLHSTGGVSTIKNRVKIRLKERNLRWSEVNPGLLKVKIFSASKHSKNI